MTCIARIGDVPMMRYRSGRLGRQFSEIKGMRHTVGAFSGQPDLVLVAGKWMTADGNKVQARNCGEEEVSVRTLQYTVSPEAVKRLSHPCGPVRLSM